MGYLLETISILSAAFVSLPTKIAVSGRAG